MSDASLFNLSALEPAPATDPAVSTPASSSQSLYRKYRPQTFDADELFGQEHVVNTLRNAIALDRIAHAYLFCGPRGTGKTTTARLLAKAVNCLDPDPYQRPCNHCEACVAINKGATTDVIEIDAASNRGIDDIRDLRERVKYAPTQLKTKFYIIDEAHQITGAAANAFLKTLEEPPAHTKFVLATTDPEELLQTIVSRCQRFDFRRINSEAMQACLRSVAAKEQIEIEDDAIMAITRHATGSLRDALGLLDQVAVYRENDQDTRSVVTLDLVRTVLGVSRNDRVEALVAALADRDPSAGLDTIGKALDDGEDMRQLGRQLVAYLRLLMLQRAGGTTDADDTAKQLAARFELPDLAWLLTRFADIDNKVKHATLSQLPLELALVEGAMRGIATIATAPAVAQPSQANAIPRDAAPIEQRQAPPRDTREEWTPPAEQERPAERPRPTTSLRDRVRGADRGPSVPRTPPADASSREPISRAPEPRETPQPVAQQPATASPVATPPAASAAPASDISVDVVIDLWDQIKRDVKAVNRRIEALLQQIEPAKIVGDKLILVSAYEFHRNKVNADESKTVIEDVVARLLKRHLIVTCVSREEAAQMTERPAPAVAAAPVAEVTPVITEPRAAAPTSTPAARPQEAARPTPQRDVRNTPPPLDEPPMDWAPPLDDEPPFDDFAPTPRVQSAARPRPTMTARAPERNARQASAEAAALDPLDEQRIRAVKNIFDAEEIGEDEL